MSTIIKGLFAVVLFGLASSTAKAQTTFDFPLEVGNVWVYRTVDFPNECRFNRCEHYRLQVTNLVEIEDRTCGVIEFLTIDRDYVSNQSIPKSENDIGICRVDNRVYWLSNADSVVGKLMDTDMIADFDRSETDPWIVERLIYDLDYQYVMRRMVQSGQNTPIGHYGNVDYVFNNYLSIDSTGIDGAYGGEFVYGIQDYFMNGVGFPVLGWGGFIHATLLGYAINGVVTGDTTTVWATSIDHEPPTLPAVARLTQTYPNPFNPSTEIGFQMSVVGKVRLSIYDLLGREVAVLVDEVRAPGAYQQTFDAAGLPSGIYLVVLDAAGVRDRRSITLLR